MKIINCVKIKIKYKVDEKSKIVSSRYCYILNASIFSFNIATYLQQ